MLSFALETVIAEMLLHGPMTRSREDPAEAPMALVGEPLGVYPVALSRDTSVRRGKYPSTLKMPGRRALNLC